MTASAGFRVRRVGFRAGTDEELTALHAVEAPVAAERGSNRMPQSAESYIALARNLPSQFNDHAWLVEASDGMPVAAGFCWSNSAGEHRVFSRRVGGRIGRVNRTSELVLADVDWIMIKSWVRAELARRLGYRLELVDGAFPEHLRADAATFHHIMQTAPREDLDVGDVTVNADFVAELDRALIEAGRARTTIFARDPAGSCVGGTEVIIESWDPGTVLQQNTGIDPSHRGLGLAKWAKAAMLERIRDLRPEAVRVRTENAFSNAPMLAINNALGFTVVSARTEWQADVGDLLRGTPLTRDHEPPAPRHRRLTGSRSGAGGEVVTLVEVLDEAGVRRLPAQELLGQRAGDRGIQRDQRAEEAEVGACIFGRDADGRHVQVAAN